MKKLIKWSLVVFIGLGVLSAISGKTDNEQKKEKAQVATEKEKVEKTTESPTEPPSPTKLPKELTDEEKIIDKIDGLLAGKNNMKKDYKKSLEIKENEKHLFEIEIGFNASDNLSEKLIKSGIESKMSEIYIALYKEFDNIETIAISAAFPMQDKYGNKDDLVVYYSELTKDEANKINWDTYEATLKLRVLPSVWTTHLLHPLFNTN